MPYRLSIIRSSDFIRLDASGTVDFEATRQALRDLASQSVRSGLDGALLDIRDAYGNLTVGEIYKLAAGFAELGFNRACKLAILHRFNARERADFFALCAANRGWNVKAFDSFEEAYQWLGTSETLLVDSDAGPTGDGGPPPVNP
jgi:hypothetical protein